MSNRDCFVIRQSLSYLIETPLIVFLFPDGFYSDNILPFDLFPQPGNGIKVVPIGKAEPAPEFFGLKIGNPDVDEARVLKMDSGCLHKSIPFPFLLNRSSDRTAAICSSCYIRIIS